MTRQNTNGINLLVGQGYDHCNAPNLDLVNRLVRECFGVTSFNTWDRRNCEDGSTTMGNDVRNLLLPHTYTGVIADMRSRLDGQYDLIESVVRERRRSQLNLPVYLFCERNTDRNDMESRLMRIFRRPETTTVTSMNSLIGHIYEDAFFNVMREARDENKSGDRNQALSQLAGYFRRFRESVSGE